jgi:hypothetical protein
MPISFRALNIVYVAETKVYLSWEKSMLIYISNILNAIKVHNPPKAPILATYGVTTSILAVAPKDCIIEKQLPATT